MRLDVRLGDVVLLRVEGEVQRPLTVTSVGKDGQLSGVISCEPNDYAMLLFRGALDRQIQPGRIEGRPTASCPVAFAKSMTFGMGVGQWQIHPKAPWCR